VANERAAIALTAAEVDELLRAARTLVLVTIGLDGLPHPVPMWYCVDEGGAVWMRTYAASQKVQNLERDARFSALVETGDRYDELRGAQLSGTVAVVDDVDTICEVVAGLLVRYEGLDPAHADAVKAAYRPRAAKQRALRLDVDRVASWDHRKQSAPGHGALG
jgi:PPOX class probable F420-dependent enzyme